ncbi:MAG TPA: c-type cytochrome [Vicinamibacterales bacterium]|jgi:mono/diheme cytochrome c family protein
MTALISRFTALLALVISVGCAAQGAADHENAASAKRGEYLVNTSGCHDCHTPFKMGPQGPEPDMSRMLSGHPETFPVAAPAGVKGPWVWAAVETNTAFSGPWGISYTANLTPDRNTGLGIWTEDMFMRAIRTGRHMGQSRPINPPMPWPAYRNFTDDDLKAIFTYLRTIPPITNHVPDYLPPPAAATTETR